jgi:hypothetical protein
LRLLHHLRDLVCYRLRQAKRLTHDFIDILSAGTVDHQLSPLARGKEIRILEQRSKCGSQSAQPLRRHTRRGENPSDLHAARQRFLSTRSKYPIPSCARFPASAKTAP